MTTQAAKELPLELFNLLMRRYCTVSLYGLVAVIDRWVAESQVLSSEDRHCVKLTVDAV